MTLQVNSIQYVLWGLSPLLQLVIVMLMVTRKIYHELPVFFCYAIFHIAQFLAGYVAHTISYRAYFYVYWGTEFIDALFGLLVIQEVYSHAFRDLHGFQSLGTALFRWAALILSVVSIIAAIQSPGTDESRMLAGLIVSERSIHLLQGGLVLLLFVMCRTFTLCWDQYTFGIALGFALSSMISMAAAAMKAHYGASADNLFIYLLPIGSNVSVAIWTWYLSRRQPEPLDDVFQPIQYSENLAAWNRALEKVTRS